MNFFDLKNSLRRGPHASHKIRKLPKIQILTILNTYSCYFNFKASLNVFKLDFYPENPSFPITPVFHTNIPKLTLVV